MEVRGYEDGPVVAEIQSAYLLGEFAMQAP